MLVTVSKLVLHQLSADFNRTMSRNPIHQVSSLPADRIVYTCYNLIMKVPNTEYLNSKYIFPSNNSKKSVLLYDADCERSCAITNFHSSSKNHVHQMVERFIANLSDYFFITISTTCASREHQNDCLIV